MCRCARAPLFFGVVGVALEGGGQAVAEELAAAVEEEGLAGVEDAAQRGLPGVGLEPAGEIQGHLDDLPLQGGLGEDRRFRHLTASYRTGRRVDFYHIPSPVARFH
jgi:hypothetical protein